MIPQHAITAWRLLAPWGSPEQVEQDLVLSRAICQLYSDPKLAEDLVFRGGTALHKLFFKKAGRYRALLQKFTGAKNKPSFRHNYAA